MRSHMLELVLLLGCVSATSGFVGGIFGIGGGVLIVPALTLLFHVPVRAAIGVSLLSVVATSAGASAAFVRDGWTNLRVAMALEVATTSGALAPPEDRSAEAAAEAIASDLTMKLYRR